MNKLIIDILKVKELTSCSYIAVLVPIGFDLSVDTRQHDVVSDIELSIVVKKWSVDVGLNNIGLRVTILVLSFLYQLADFTKGG
jgi:hypothetical protein